MQLIYVTFGCQIIAVSKSCPCSYAQGMSYCEMRKRASGNNIYTSTQKPFLKKNTQASSHPLRQLKNNKANKKKNKIEKQYA